jgi:hypothetical protein
MPASLNRFLKAKTAISNADSLGRTFNVTRQTWSLTDDPRRTPPKVELTAMHRTASEAADLARDIAAGFIRHGFHKPSGAWWAADDTSFHRFPVHIGRVHLKRAGPMIGLALVTLAAVALRRSQRRAGPTRPGTPG